MLPLKSGETIGIYQPLDFLLAHGASDPIPAYWYKQAAAAAAADEQVEESALS
jgi:hypothetical protein